MKELIKKMKKNLKEYQKMAQAFEKKGLENLSYEETEFYGAYLGKAEILEQLIPEIQALA